MSKILSRLSGIHLKIMLLFLTIALPAIQVNQIGSQAWSTELRNLKLERLHWVRVLGLLQENPAVVSSINAKSETLESVTLSILEAVKAEAEKNYLELYQLNVSRPKDLQNADIDLMRVTLSVGIERTLSLLVLFDAVRESATWRVSEVRGCSVARTNNGRQGLLANCAMDVYYHPAVDQ